MGPEAGPSLLGTWLAVHSVRWTFPRKQSAVLELPVHAWARLSAFSRTRRVCGGVHAGNPRFPNPALQLSPLPLSGLVRAAWSTKTCTFQHILSWMLQGLGSQHLIHTANLVPHDLRSRSLLPRVCLGSSSKWCPLVSALRVACLPEHAVTRR